MLNRPGKSHKADLMFRKSNYDTGAITLISALVGVLRRRIFPLCPYLLDHLRVRMHEFGLFKDAKVRIARRLPLNRMEGRQISRPLVSIITPVYNCEACLEHCLLSLKYQKMERLEFIVIDDGSTDGSAAIARSFAKCDARFHVVTQKNSGVAGARNTGLLHANGDYIGFVDADDYISPDMFQSMYDRILSTGSDLAICGYTRVWSNGKEDQVLALKDEVLNVPAVGMDKFYLKYFSRSPVLWNKLYRSALIEKYKISFDLTHGEDVLFNLRILPFLKQVCVLSDALYYYIQREGSLTNTGTVDTMNPVNLMNAWQGWKLENGRLPYFVFYDQFTGFLFSAQCLGRSYSFFYRQIARMGKAPFFSACCKRLAWTGDLRCIYQNGSLSRQFYLFLKVCFALCDLHLHFLAAAVMWTGQRWIAAQRGRKLWQKKGIRA